MNNVSLSVNNNVSIKIIDKYGKVQRSINVHNKANQQMVLGLLRFLSGDFNKTSFNDSDSRIFNSDADQYIPVQLSFGNVGVKMRDRSSDTPHLDSIAYEEMKAPTFDEVRLQNEIITDFITGDGFNLNFTDISLTSYDDTNNSMALMLRKFIPAGKLVGRNSEDAQGELIREHYIDNLPGIGDSNGWSYYNEASGEYEALFTEIGLYAKSLQGKNYLLARVLFNGSASISDEGEVTFDDDNYENNPIIQSDSSSILVEWKIGIVSIGQNDKILSGADLRNLGIDDTLKDLYMQIGKIYADTHITDYDSIYEKYMKKIIEYKSNN